MGRPTGVTLIAVLYFIGGGFCVIGGLGLMLGGGLLASMMNSQGGQGAGIFAALGAAAGIALLIGAALCIVIGIGLIKMQNWARIIAMVFAGLGLLFGALALFTAFAHFVVFALFWVVVRLAINGLILWYLLQPQVAAAFSGQQARGATA